MNRSMILARIRHTSAVFVLLAVVQAAGATNVLADHCGAQMDISPTSGPGGTTFTIKPNLGADTILTLRRNGQSVLVVRLADPAVTFRFRSRSGDAGAWSAEARVEGHEACRSEVAFRITGLPSTSIATRGSVVPPSRGPVPAVVLVAGATLGAVLGLHRTRGPVVRRVE